MFARRWVGIILSGSELAGAFVFVGSRSGISPGKFVAGHGADAAVAGVFGRGHARDSVSLSHQFVYGWACGGAEKRGED